MDDEATKHANPYAPPTVRPLRGFWSRLYHATGRAISRYRKEMRRDGIGPIAELRAWLALLALLALGGLMVTLILLMLFFVLGPYIVSPVSF